MICILLLKGEGTKCLGVSGQLNMVGTTTLLIGIRGWMTSRCSDDDRYSRSVIIWFRVGKEGHHKWIYHISYCQFLNIIYHKLHLKNMQKKV